MLCGQIALSITLLVINHELTFPASIPYISNNIILTAINKKNNMNTSTTPNTFKNNCSLVITEQGLSGLNILLISGNVPDTDEEINVAVAKPELLKAQYFLTIDKIDLMIETLLQFKEKAEVYSYYQNTFGEYLDDPQMITKIVAEQLDLGGENNTNSIRHKYFLGFETNLFVSDIKNKAEAVNVVLKDWETQFGSATMWDITLYQGWITSNNLTSAIKFENWFVKSYVIPTLKKLTQI